MDGQETDLDLHEQQVRQRILEMLRNVARAVVQQVAGGSSSSTSRKPSADQKQSSGTLAAHHEHVRQR